MVKEAKLKMHISGIVQFCDDRDSNIVLFQKAAGVGQCKLKGLYLVRSVQRLGDVNQNEPILFRNSEVL